MDSMQRLHMVAVFVRMFGSIEVGVQILFKRSVNKVYG